MVLSFHVVPGLVVFYMILAGKDRNNNTFIRSLQEIIYFSIVFSDVKEENRVFSVEWVPLLYKNYVLVKPLHIFIQIALILLLTSKVTLL